LHDCGADGLNRSQDQRKQAESGRYQGENGCDDAGYIAVFELDLHDQGRHRHQREPCPF